MPTGPQSYAETGAEEHLHEVEAIAQLGSWSWEVGDDAVHWSDGLYRLYGLAPQSVPVTFTAFVEITPPEIREEVVSTILRCVETGDGYTFRTRTVQGAGSVRWRYSRANTVTRDGRVARMFGTTQDVTERMLTEEVLRDSLEEAERLAHENETLRAAVEAQLAEVRASRARRRSPVAVRLRADSIGVLPSGVESAAYFVVAEALTNVVKHARASQAQVTVQRRGGGLLVEVSDDGSGGPTVEAGSGLRGLSDRVAALGGRLELYSPVPGGTLLRVELPFGGDSPAA